MILPAVLCECETWSFVLIKNPRLKVSYNMVLRIIQYIRPTKDEVTGEWKKLYYEEFYVLFPLAHIILLSNQEKVDGCGMKSLWGRGEVRTGFW